MTKSKQPKNVKDTSIKLPKRQGDSLLDRLRPHKQLVFVVGFAFIGTAVTFVTLAATPTASVEPEVGTRTNATLLSDQSASGELAIKFSATSQTSPVTVTPTRIGNPFTVATYPRNVWDMQVFNGKIYFGHGNSSNENPYANAGPIPVISYNPDANTFTTEYTVSDEQVEKYRILNGVLYIPGHDPRGSDNPGNYYRLESSGWVQIRTIPQATHNYDMQYYQGKIFAALGAYDGRKALLMSNDNGQTWLDVHEPVGYFGRAYSLIKFKDKLYGIQDGQTNGTSGTANIYVFNDTTQFFDNTNKQLAHLMPGDVDLWLRIAREEEFNDQLLFVGGEYYNDHQYTPLGLFKTSDMQSGTRVTLPVSNVVPYDILQRDGVIYVLGAVLQPSGQYINYVFSSSDLTNWTHRFNFTTVTFARSFEEINGDFYFGLGSNTAPLSGAIGDVFKVPSTAY